MSWDALVIPLAAFADEWAWIGEVVIDPLPESPPAVPAPATASRVLELLGAAQLAGRTWPGVEGVPDDVLGGPDPRSAPDDRYVGELRLHVDGPVGATVGSPEYVALLMAPVAADREISAVMFGGGHPHAVLRAAAALVPAWGPVVAMDAGGCRSVVVDREVTDLVRTADRWLDYS